MADNPASSKGGYRTAEHSAVQVSINAAQLDDDPTTVTGAALNCAGYRYFTLYLDLDATLTPTTLELIVEFSEDGGTTWYEHRQGLFAALFYEDTEIVSGLKEVFQGDVLGQDVRVRGVAVGSDATDFFTVTAKMEFMN